MSRGIRIGINGFGRIGRAIFKSLDFSKVDYISINDLTDSKTLAHLLKYDSVHGKIHGTVECDEKHIIFNQRKIPVTAIKDPTTLRWKEQEVDVVVESTGLFTDRASAQKHLEAGAKKVLISAPGKNVDFTVVMGINHQSYDAAKHHVISNGSCTTNCLAPIAYYLDQKFGIQRAVMTTIHSYTNDQNVLDLPHKDLRRARAAALSMIPTTTGAAKAVVEILPHLKGKIDGLAVRVPTPNVSLVDFTAQVGKSTSVAEVNALFKDLSQNTLKNILGYTEEPIVSIDVNHNPLSSLVDGLSTFVIDGTLIKVLSWYDNEWGFSNRMVDLIDYIYSKGL